MNVLSLCSGIGGLDRGLGLAVQEARTICYVELDPFCQEILLRRADDGWLDRAPVWPDLRTFDGRPWRGVVDCVSSGFPCQPFSTAGKRKGDADARNLWPDVRRIIAESEPAVVVLENVPGALPYFYHVVLPELSGLGYAASAGLFTAAEVGAPHRRQRLFVLAVADSRYRTGGPKQGGERQAMGAGTILGRSGEEHLGDAESSDWFLPVFFGGSLKTRIESGRTGADVGHPEPARLQGRLLMGDPGLGEMSGQPPAWPPGPTERDRWAEILARWPDLAPAVEDASRSGQRGSQREDGRRRRVSQAGGELADAEDGGSRGSGGRQRARGPAERIASESPIRGVADGIASRIQQLRALGNAVVPAQAAHAIRMLMDRLT